MIEVARTMPELEQVSNDAATLITPPYRVAVTLQGTCPLLFHRYSCEAVEEKANAAKGSTAKKTDDLESYIYRTSDGHIALPGEYVRMACVWAAKFRQDPRSPRKSAMDLYKAGLVCETDLADLGKSEWDFVDQRRAVVQRNAVTRRRPALNEGWRATFIFCVLTPEYITPTDLCAVFSQAGLVVGVGDFRPTYGRFAVVNFEVLGE